MAEHNRFVRLELVCVGHTPSIAAFTSRIEHFSHLAAIYVSHSTLPITASAHDVASAIAQLNATLLCDGIAPLLPFPERLHARQLCAAISPEKDVDGLTPHNVGRLALGEPSHRPCAAQAALFVAQHLVGDLRGAQVSVVGASANLGQPLALMLLQTGATVTVAHRDTVDLAAATRSADVLFVAAGQPHLIGAAHVKSGATVIDLGVNVGRDGAVIGDVDVDSIATKAAAITRAPDGVGPLTAAFLLANTLRAALGEAFQPSPNS